MPPNPLCFWTSMDVFWIPLLLTLLLLHQTASASDPTEVFGVLGGSVTFHSPNADGKAAFWSFGNDPILTVIFEDPPRPIFLNEKLKARFAVSEDGRALRISQLRMEDAGTYSVKIDGKTSTFTLQVFRELAEPTVTCEAQNCSDGSCHHRLRCSAPGDGSGNVSYTWRGQDRTWDGSSVVLLVNETSPDEPGPLTCTARNRVSSRSVTVTSPGALCAGTHSSSQVELGGGFWIIIGIFMLLSLAVLVLLLIYKASPGRRKFWFSQSKPADTAVGATNDYTTVYAEVGHSQQPVPEGPKAKPAEGGPATIYSLVKRPEPVDGGKAGNAATAGLELV